MLHNSNYSIINIFYLGIIISFYLYFPNLAIATDAINQNSLDKSTNLSTLEPTIVAPQRNMKNKYGRISNCFIINQGRVDEQIQIHMDGRKKAVTIIDKKVLQDEDLPKQNVNLQDEDLSKQNVQLRPFRINEEMIEGVIKAKAVTNPEEADVIAGYLATVTGPGELSFHWKVSCEPSGAYMEATLDGSMLLTISGETDWRIESIPIPEGTHIFCWLYHKVVNCSFGADGGWVDKVQFAPQSPDNNNKL
jgi:hypothetical protein